MYKIFFGKRYLSLLKPDNLNLDKNDQSTFLCKNSKSFELAYNLFHLNNKLPFINLINPRPEKLFNNLAKKFVVIKAAGGLVEKADKQILLMKRNEVWDLPKGKIEKKEKKRTAAIREVTEECGLSNLSIISKIGKTYHTYLFDNQPILKVTHWYKMIYSGNENPVPQIEEGISEIKWVEKSGLNYYIELCHPNLVSILESSKPN
jgi:8-oxo-dGTP pyrophosphatase MutT (NUDIX family)